jgi:hypothetical protein
MPKGCATARLSTGPTHSRKNSAMPHSACTAQSGPCPRSTSCASTSPITAGGATVIIQAGSRRSGSGLCAMRRASISVSTTGQKKAPAPNCAIAQPAWPSGMPASGASTLPTTGISSTGVTAGHSPVLPGVAPTAGASQRPSTHSVAQSWPRLPAHQSARHTGANPPDAPPSATPTVASSSSETGKAATNAWRTGCFRSSASAAG